jgi:hypothetical protein
MSEETVKKITPRVWKAMRYAGTGYDIHGKQRDGMNYCDLAEAVKLETELQAAQKEITALKKQNAKLLKSLCVFSTFGTGPCGGGGSLDLVSQGIRATEYNVRALARKELKKHAGSI